MLRVPVSRSGVIAPRRRVIRRPRGVVVTEQTGVPLAALAHMICVIAAERRPSRILGLRAWTGAIRWSDVTEPGPSREATRE